MPTITIQTEDDDKPRSVDMMAYVRAKTKQLREFGYHTLKQEDVAEQLEAILKGGATLANGKLTIIGSFMEKEVIVPAQDTDAEG